MELISWDPKSGLRFLPIEDVEEAEVVEEEISGADSEDLIVLEVEAIEEAEAVMETVIVMEVDIAAEEGTAEGEATDSRGATTEEIEIAPDHDTMETAVTVLLLVAITDRETETAAAAEEDATAVTVAEVAAAADLTDPEDRLRPALTATFRKQRLHLFLHHKNNNNNVSSSLFSVCFIFNSLFWLLLRHIL